MKLCHLKILIITIGFIACESTEPDIKSVNIEFELPDIIIVNNVEVNDSLTEYLLTELSGAEDSIKVTLKSEMEFKYLGVLELVRFIIHIKDVRHLVYVTKNHYVTVIVKDSWESLTIAYRNGSYYINDYLIPAAHFFDFITAFLCWNNSGSVKNSEQQLADLLTINSPNQQLDSLINRMIDDMVLYNDCELYDVE